MPTINNSTYSLRHLTDVCGGDHVCFLCNSNEERWRVLGEFYNKGLENNEKMMFFYNTRNVRPEGIMNGLMQKIPNVRELVAKNQLQIIKYTDIYLTNGKFDSEALIARLSNEVNKSLVEGYTGLRACGDMSWVHNEDDLTKKLIHYESHLNHDWPEHYSAICMYDICEFQPEDMLQILSTHPQAVINEKLNHNIYYMPPDEYLGPNLGLSMLNRWMRNIEERKMIEEQLIASKIEAEKAASAKATFLATMSHEIRNPMNGIIGSIDMLSQTHISNEQKELVTIIQSSAKHLYKVVNDILDFSKLENEKMHLSYTPLKVNDLLQESIRLCQYSIQKNLAVTLRFDTHPSCPEIIVSDETKLRQVLVNLVGNACKFTDEGEVAIYVTPVEESMNSPELYGRREKRENERILEFSVTDSGCGIDPNDQGLLFKTFSKLDTSRKWVGTGLGLAISKQLIEAMGGTISLKSKPGRGSTFYFHVPITVPTTSTQNDESAISISPVVTPHEHHVVTPHEHNIISHSPTLCSFGPTPSLLPSPVLSSSPVSLSPPLPSSSELNGGKTCLDLSETVNTNSKSSSPIPIPSPSPSYTIPLSLPSPLLPNASPMVISSDDNFSHHRVLIAEDDKINQRVLTKMLERLKCCVTVANNGMEALNLASSNAYTLVITDQYMPTMDGVTATHKIRALLQDQGRACPPVVVCTGTDEPRLHEIMDYVLLKPVRFQTLLDMMRSFRTNKIMQRPIDVNIEGLAY